MQNYKQITRLENNERPSHEETKSIIDEESKESDRGRLERFKKWAKENIVDISAVAIAIADIIITIVVRLSNKTRIKSNGKSSESNNKHCKGTRTIDCTNTKSNCANFDMGSKRYWIPC